MEPLGIVLFIFLVISILFFGSSKGSSRLGSSAEGDRTAAARDRRSQAYSDVLADYAGGRISVAQRDAQLAHVSKWPVEGGGEGRGSR